MEHVHGIDVSWMTHGAPKDKTNRSTLRRPSVSSQHNDPSAPSRTPPSTNGNDSAQLQVPSFNGPKTPSPPRPGFMRGNSTEKQSGQNGQNGGALQRRASWLQNISSKFSSSSASPPVQSPPPQPDLNAAPADPPVPKIAPAKNAVLQHATKHEGDGPYTPAPPKSQGSFLQVFRRFSGTNGGNQTQSVKGNHGLVDRITLNVDQHRERCPIRELNQAKLRRVAFCVDVEIAPMPKYSDSTVNVNKVGKTQRKLSEKGEAEALKNPDAVKEQKEKDGVIHATGEPVPKEPEIEGSDASTPQKEGPTAPVPQREVSAKKKEKKKRSEEERKARKEKKRQQAEASGSIPMEIHRSSTDSDSSSSPATSGPRKTHAFPTTNPVRIYRRCCQLRESPILKKITEQLTNPSNSVVVGLVEKLDLTGYYMDLSDLVTLGDYFAVVPVREVILEGCGLTDEGLRVVLAGLLAAKRQGRRRKPSSVDGLTNQGGAVERLVLKNNKIGPEGWKHISLFLYMCRSLKYLDVSGIKFPRPIQPPSSSLGASETTAKAPINAATLFSKAIGERLAGPELELLNLGGTELKCEQLGMIIDGIIKCGIRRLGLANNEIDVDGLEHVARYLRQGKCEGLDLGGNDLRERLEVIGNTLIDDHPLWALSLADCDLNPSSLCKLLPKLAKLPNFRFIDLSHNRDLFNSDPNAVGILRRYLPKMACLKRIHLVDVALSSEQTIALVEILPEVPGLAHISLLENPHLVSLADARTEESQEEACALYASLLAATRVSSTIVCVDIDIPSESSSEVVKALAKQVVAYCLRNMEKIQVPELGTTTSSITEPEEQSQSSPLPQVYPDLLLNLVGNEPGESETEDKVEVAPDEDYVIGGTGVVKALACCLKNRGDESRRQSGEFIREVETGHIASRPKLPPGKAKDMSKHLLTSARKIRLRLQPALEKWKFNKEDKHTYQRLLFLAETLDGIIKRFEDEFPDTREPPSPPLSSSPLALTKQDSVTETIASTGADEPFTNLLSDADDDGLSTNIKPRSRSNSILSHTAKSLAEEEGRVLRAGHKFRRGFVKQEHWEVLSSLEELGSDPRHLNMLDEMVAELGDEYLKRRVAEIGVLETFRVEKERVFRLLREADPSYWARFIESQEKARVNVQPGQTPAVKVGGVVVEENAVED